jgi:Fe-S-cluster containining protein
LDILLTADVDDEVLQASPPKDSWEREVVLALLQATAKLEGTEKGEFTSVDFYRIACQAVFRCHRCGICCTTGDPIKLKEEDLVKLARHLKTPLQKASKKYTVSLKDASGGEVLAFKNVRPCKFYDPVLRGCKIYPVRPWSCRIFPFLGIYGSADRVVVHSSCPGAVEAAKRLAALVEELRPSVERSPPDHEASRRAREWLSELLDNLI